ncbi:hypothetical protein AWN68_03025 [Roseivirga echinicomitans]|uniref:Gliding motility protein GldN n=1 Tax=Roseivirga echinicomitans TaxID=296218 RepID=A0A150XYW1_9BACT|nr:hypothetical protein AWN68_03025 [Roseivirga echinicomitans]
MSASSFGQANSNGAAPIDSVQNSRRYNINSVRPIRNEDVMFSIRVWSKMDMREKSNEGWNSSHSKIVEIIFEGIDLWYNSAEGEGIAPYNPLTQGYEASDLLSDRNAYTDRVIIDGTKGEDATLDEVERWRTEAITRGVEPEQYVQQKRQEKLAPDSIPKGQIAMLEIEEDLMFDRNRSLPIWDIQSVKVVAQSDIAGGIEKEMVRIKYKDLVAYLDKVYSESFANKESNVRAFWFNPRNPRNYGISLSNAFDMRLFSSNIIKFSNPSDVAMEQFFESQIGAGKRSLMEISRDFRYQLLETMHNLWEY